MFQDPTLYPWRTVKANVSLGLEARGLLRRQGHRVDEALRLVGLTQFATAYPHQLSGGMAQRVSLARALVNDPKLLLLDEPLGKLDSMTRITMQQELVSLWQRTGFTALLVTHDVEEALFMSNRVIVLSDRPAAIKADIAGRPAVPAPSRRSPPGRTAPRDPRPAGPGRRLVTEGMLDEHSTDAICLPPPLPLSPAGHPARAADARRCGSASRRASPS